MLTVGKALIVVLLAQTILSTEGDWTEIHHMMQKARDRRNIVQQYFVNIYQGTAGKCVPFPPPTTAEKIGEECLKGYEEG